jgi:hypothetical protein
MRRTAVATLLGGMLAIAGGALPAQSAPPMPTTPAATQGAVQAVAIVYRRDRHRAKDRGKYRRPVRYHTWDKHWRKRNLHSRKYVGEKYHRHCGDWHGCHYYFYGYLQWEKWNPGGSRKYFLKRYHH